MEKYCPKCFNHYTAEHLTCPDDGSNLVQLDDRDLLGHIVDNRYTIKGRVGKGGMGVVYRAEQHLIKRIVALKVLNKDIVKDETSVKRFLNEARVIASLENPHTVTLYDFGVTGEGMIFYTMELLDGQPLSKIIEDGGPVPFAKAAMLIDQTLDSLGEAHDKGILHRDIKPENLFIVGKPGKERVKVLDFGIAKLVNESSSESITKTGMICGTPAYLSPEQVLGNKASPASDLYSLGIVLYEMLAGQPPFYSPTPMKLLLQHLNEEPVPLSVKNPNIKVPAAVNGFLDKALKKDPADRFASVELFRIALEKALSGADGASDTVNLAGIATTSAGMRTLSAESVTDSSKHAHPIVKESELSHDTPANAIVDTSGVTGASPGISGDDLTEEVDDYDEFSESTAALMPKSNKGLYVGLGVGGAVLLAVLFVWQPWAGSPPADETPSKIALNDEKESAPSSQEEAAKGASPGSAVVVEPDIMAESDQSLGIDIKTEAEVASLTSDIVIAEVASEVTVEDVVPATPEVVSLTEVQVEDGSAEPVEQPGGLAAEALAQKAAVKSEVAEKEAADRKRRALERKKKDAAKRAARKKAEAAKKAAEEKKKVEAAKKAAEEKKKAEAAKKAAEAKKKEEAKKKGGFKKIKLDGGDEKKGDKKGFKRIPLD
jgi:serine/threonine protein kinase